METIKSATAREYIEKCVEGYRRSDIPHIHAYAAVAIAEQEIAERAIKIYREACRHYSGGVCFHPNTTGCRENVGTAYAPSNCGDDCKQMKSFINKLNQ